MNSAPVAFVLVFASSLALAQTRPANPPAPVKPPAPAAGQSGSAPAQQAPAATGASPQEASVERSLRKGLEMMSTGDISGARLLFLRLSEAGHAAALFHLAETYDAEVLARLNVRGIRPDPDKARLLYSAAKEAAARAAVASTPRPGSSLTASPPPAVEKDVGPTGSVPRPDRLAVEMAALPLPPATGPAIVEALPPLPTEAAPPIPSLAKVEMPPPPAPVSPPVPVSSPVPVPPQAPVPPPVLVAPPVVAAPPVQIAPPVPVAKREEPQPASEEPPRPATRSEEPQLRLEASVNPPIRNEAPAPPPPPRPIPAAKTATAEAPSTPSAKPVGQTPRRESFASLPPPMMQIDPAASLPPPPAERANILFLIVPKSVQAIADLEGQAVDVNDEDASVSDAIRRTFAAAGVKPAYVDSPARNLGGRLSALLKGTATSVLLFTGPADLVKSSEWGFNHRLLKIPLVGKSP